MQFSFWGTCSVSDIDDVLARTLRAMIPALASAPSDSRLAALPDGLELRGELGLSAKDIQSLADSARRMFGIEIPDDELAACVTLGHLSRLIHNKVAQEKEAAAFN